MICLLGLIERVCSLVTGFDWNGVIHSASRCLHSERYKKERLWAGLDLSVDESVPLFSSDVCVHKVLDMMSNLTSCSGNRAVMTNRICFNRYCLVRFWPSSLFPHTRGTSVTTPTWAWFCHHWKVSVWVSPLHMGRTKKRYLENTFCD